MQIPTYKPPYTFIFLPSFWPLILPTQSPPSLCISNKTTWHSFFFLSPLQDGGIESPTSGPEVKRFWIWGTAVSDLQWLLTPCLSIPISAAFLHSWEMCLLPCTLCCQTWSSLCCLGTCRMHTRSQCLPPVEAKLNYMLSGKMEERISTRRNVCSLAVLSKALKGNSKTGLHFIG